MISDYSAYCATKIRLLSLLNKSGLIRDQDDNSERIKEKEYPREIHPANINQSSQGQEIMFLHRKTKKQPNNMDIQPSDSPNESPKGRLRYRMLSFNHHDLYKTKGYYANIKTPGRYEDGFNNHFDKVKIILTNEGISFIQRKVMKR